MDNDRPPDGTNPTAFRLGLVALALTGAALGAWPHLAWLVRSGDWEYLADGDQLLYMGWSRAAALRGSPVVGDAVHPEGGPMMHPWLLFVPPAWLAHQSGLGLRGLTVLWRLLGGAGVALGLFAALRPAVRDRRLALGLASLLLCDAGLLFGQPLYRQADALLALAARSGRYVESVPRVMAHLRVVPPALALPFLLAHLGLVARARSVGGWVSVALAGVSLGLIFDSYFYFWTTALAALALAFALDAPGRQCYAAVALLGLTLGCPAVLAGARVKAAYPPDWLLRTDKFVPIGRFEELLIPKVPIALWLATAPWVFSRRRDLTYWWCVVGAGFACANSQVVTRLQVENFHWLFAPGVTLSLLLAALGGSFLFERAGPTAGDAPAVPGRAGLRWLAVAVAVQAVLGFGLRWGEATRSAETLAWHKVAGRLAADGVSGGPQPSIPEGAVLAGDREGVMLQAARRDVFPLSGKFIEYCAGITDTELDERLVLNLFLNGLDRQAARREVARPAGTLSWEAQATRSEAVARQQRLRRLGLIERVWSDPSRWVARFGVTHLLLPTGGPHPVAALHAAGVRSERLASGKFWQVWRLSPLPRADNHR